MNSSIITNIEECSIEEIYKKILKLFIQIGSNKSDDFTQVPEHFTFEELTIKDKDIYINSLLFYKSIYMELLNFCYYYFSEDFPNNKKHLYKCYEFFGYIMTLKKFSLDDDKIKLPLILLIDELYNIKNVETLETVIDNFQIVILILRIRNDDFSNSFFNKVTQEVQNRIDNIIEVNINQIRQQIVKEMKCLYNQIMEKLSGEDDYQKTISEFSFLDYTYIDSDLMDIYRNKTLKELETLYNDFKSDNYTIQELYKNNQEFFRKIEKYKESKKEKKGLILYYYFCVEPITENIINEYQTKFEMDLLLPSQRDLLTMIHNENFRKFFKEVVNSQLYASFFENTYHGKKCLVAYEKFKEEINKENYNKESVGLDNFFNKYIHLAVLPKYKKAITVRYLHIFINELNFRFEHNNGIETQEKLTKAFLLLVLLHELVHFLFRIGGVNQLSSQWATIDQDGQLKEGGMLLQEFLLGQYFINSIDIIQAEAIINIDNWKSNENPLKKTFDVLLLKNKAKLTDEEKKLTKMHTNISSIKFMSTKQENINWCGATFP